MLLARANGTWSYPAFYGMGSGSFGLQIGIQDAQFMTMIMTERGLNAILNSQFKIGVLCFLGDRHGRICSSKFDDKCARCRHHRVLAYARAYGGISLGGSLTGQRQLGSVLLRPGFRRAGSSSACRVPILALIRCVMC